MSVVLLNTVALDDGIIIKKGSGGGGGIPINNQEKSVDITENGTTEVVADAGFTGLSKVVVNTNVASSGGGTTIVSPKDVNFRDYDGTVLYAYTKDEFLALNELPPLPTQAGLICQGWNWTLEDAKAYVEEYGVLEVGATYITDDGKTRLYITIAAEGRMNVPLALQQSVGEGVVVDWGDGSATETFGETSATTLRHTYGKVGDYVITLEVLNGTLTLKGTSSCGIFADSMRVYPNMLQKVEIGNSVTSIGSNAFQNCYSLSSVVIPNGVTSIGSNAFQRCSSLSSVVMPNSVTSIGNYAFKSCYSLSSVVIPNGVISIGGEAFYYCYSLSSVVMPNSVKSIGSNAFYCCSSLSSVVMPNSVTSIGNYAFQNCYSLSSVVIPNGVTSIGSDTFNGCSSLSSVVIPNGVTSISYRAFQNCSSLSSVVMPNSVTSIGDYAFQSCSSIAFFDFRAYTSVPTLLNYNAFSSIASDAKIVVPDELYDSWIAATNWSNSNVAKYIVKASEFNG